VEINIIALRLTPFFFSHIIDKYNIMNIIDQVYRICVPYLTVLGVTDIPKICND